MLFSSNETSATYDKPFASAEYTTNTSLRPYVSVTYSDYIAVSQICMESGTRELSVNDTAQLTATVVPSNATNKNIVWTSSNSSIAAVGTTGLVCAHKPGTVTITAASAADSSKFAVCSVTVKRPAIVIIPGIMGSELFAGEAITFLENGAVSASIPKDSKLWDPPASNPVEVALAWYKVKSLACNSNGTSINNIYAKNENYGALSMYATLYNTLSEWYGNQYDIIYFPYDWRMSTFNAANALKTRLENYGSVIIIAHSMGGLVASNYLRLEGAVSKVNKLITLGTPFLGAPKLIDVYINGNVLGSFPQDLYLKITGAIPGIIPNIPSVYELLPTKEWFTIANKKVHGVIMKYDVPGYEDDGEVHISPSYEDTKGNLYFGLDSFNSSLFTSAESMHNSLYVGTQHITSLVDSYYIAGYNLPTITFIKTDSTVSDNYYFDYEAKGDGTVPVWSANLGGLYPNKCYYAANMQHGTSNGNSLVDNTNVLALIKKIINEQLSSLPAGITQTAPVY